MWSQGVIAEGTPGLSEHTRTPIQGDSLDVRPVSFPFWMVQAIALDLEEKSRLDLEVLLLEKELATYKILVSGLEENGRRKDLQLELSRKNTSLLELQLQAEKAEKAESSFLQRGLGLLGALVTGYILGAFR